MSTKSITFQTADSIITSGDAIGSINFAASNESDGSASTLIVARIQAESEGVFNTIQNPCSLNFYTAESDASSARSVIKFTDLGNILPTLANTQSLGSINNEFKDAWISSGVQFTTNISDTSELLYRKDNWLWWNGYPLGQSGIEVDTLDSVATRGHSTNVSLTLSNTLYLTADAIVSGDISINSSASPAGTLEVKSAAGDQYLLINGADSVCKIGDMDAVENGSYISIDSIGSQVRFISTKVGIGAGNPAVPLHIAGSFTGEQVRLADSSATGSPSLTFYQTTTERAEIEFSDPANQLRLKSLYGDISLMTDSSGVPVERIHIGEGGYVNIYNDGFQSACVPQPIVDIRGGDGSTDGGLLTLSTDTVVIVDGDKLGRINFQAPSEGYPVEGGDNIAVAASIWAEADSVFSSTVNSCELVFATAASEAATEKMRLTSDGRLGIGTSTPNDELEVLKALTPTIACRHTTATSYSQIAAINNGGTTTNDGVRIIVLGSSYATGSNVAYAADGGAIEAGSNLAGGLSIVGQHTTGGEIRFFCGGIVAANQMMTITNDGDVGIGTATPGAKLHVWDSTDVTSAGAGAFRIGASATTFMAFDNNEIQVIASSSPGDLHLNADGGAVKVHEVSDGTFAVNIDQLYVTASGLVGINTTTPVTELEVRGGESNGGILTLSTPETAPVPASNAFLGQILFQAPLGAGEEDDRLVAAAIKAKIAGTFGKTSNQTDLVFYTALSETATEKMRLLGLNGYLGIGTPAPVTLLDVSGVVTATSFTGSIVGLSGTMAEFDTACYDGDFMYVGDAPTAHTHTLQEVTDAGAITDVNIEVSGATNSLISARTTNSNAYGGVFAYGDDGNSLSIRQYGGSAFGFGLVGPDYSVIYSNSAAGLHIGTTNAAAPITFYVGNAIDAKVTFATTGMITALVSGDSIEWAQAYSWGDHSTAGYITEGVTTIGSPVNNQMAIWTGSGTIEGDENLTWDGTAMQVSGLLTVAAGVGEQIALNGTSPTSNPLISWNQDGTRRSFIQHADAGDILVIASEYGDIQLKTGTGGSETIRMVIDQAGAVCFGTDTAPNYDIHLYKGSAVDMVVGHSVATSYASVAAQNNGSTTDLSYAIRMLAFGTTYSPGSNAAYAAAGGTLTTGSNLSAGLALASQSATNGIRMYAGGLTTADEFVRIETDGSVGVGTTGIAPTAKFEVQGTICNTTLNAEATGAGTTATLTFDDGNIMELDCTSATGAITITLVKPTKASQGWLIIKRSSNAYNLLWAAATGTDWQWLGGEPTWTGVAYQSATHCILWSWDGTSVFSFIPHSTDVFGTLQTGSV